MKMTINGDLNCRNSDHHWLILNFLSSCKSKALDVIYRCHYYVDYTL